ncbi:hypothetical protein T265_15280, partial [Opisthorchis viverrini]
MVARHRMGAKAERLFFIIVLLNSRNAFTCHDTDYAGYTDEPQVDAKGRSVDVDSAGDSGQ